ncbi:MAG: hypothetical protein GY754_46265 [bacterium]|nr:hypothetical protein [bacterium]
MKRALFLILISFIISLAACSQEYNITYEVMGTSPEAIITCNGIETRSAIPWEYSTTRYIDTFVYSEESDYVLTLSAKNPPEYNGILAVRIYENNELVAEEVAAGPGAVAKVSIRVWE